MSTLPDIDKLLALIPKLIELERKDSREGVRVYFGEEPTWRFELAKARQDYSLLKNNLQKEIVFKTLGYEETELAPTVKTKRKWF